MIREEEECLAQRGLSRIPKIAIIDYGIGNLFSMRCALQKVGLDAAIVSKPQDLKEYDGMVLPGVGNFRSGAENLRDLRMDIARLVDDDVPILGICLGMQLLFEESEESPGEGLSLIRGRVLRLPGNVKTPHMGWNTLRILDDNELLNGISGEDYFYFVHSYYASPAENVIVAETEYGIQFASVIAKKNIFGTQFHPEKSGKPGRKVLRNFAGIVKR